jgi:hypothetical protein
VDHYTGVRADVDRLRVLHTPVQFHTDVCGFLYSRYNELQKCKITRTACIMPRMVGKTQLMKKLTADEAFVQVEISWKLESVRFRAEIELS